MRKGQPVSYLITEKVLHQVGHYGVARIIVRDEAKVTGLALKDTGLKERDIIVLAVERGDEVVSLPQEEEMILPGDYLLCYGKVTEMVDITQ